MREIKFRAWDEGNKRFWDSCVWGGSDWSLCEDRPTGFPISQYTGLLDKNGKEIYEGDIVFDDSKDYGGNKVVRWDKHSASFELDKVLGHALTQSNHIEVIGNIFENRELIKE